MRRTLNNGSSANMKSTQRFLIDGTFSVLAPPNSCEMLYAQLHTGQFSKPIVFCAELLTQKPVI